MENIDKFIKIRELNKKKWEIEQEIMAIENTGNGSTDYALWKRHNDEFEAFTVRKNKKIYIDSLSEAEKAVMREQIVKGNPWSDFLFFKKPGFIISLSDL